MAFETPSAFDHLTPSAENSRLPEFHRKFLPYMLEYAKVRDAAKAANIDYFDAVRIADSGQFSGELVLLRQTLTTHIAYSIDSLILKALDEVRRILTQSKSDMVKVKLIELLLKYRLDYIKAGDFETRLNKIQEKLRGST